MLNDPNQIPSAESEDIAAYLESHIEVDAHAHDAAEEMLAVYGEQEALKMLSGRPDLDDPKLPNALQHYFEILPSDSPALKSFRKKLFAYIKHMAS